MISWLLQTEIQEGILVSTFLVAVEKVSVDGVVYPANSVPVVVRQTGMEGAKNSPREEAHTRADCERSAAD